MIGYLPRGKELPTATHRVLAFGERGSSRRDEREFTRLYQESYGIVYNYVRHRMPADQAEDVVAEAFMLAARSFNRFDPSRAKFSTWVTKIAINCMVSYYRKERAVIALDEVPESLFAEPAEQGQVDDRDLVDRLLGVLDIREREIVLLKYQEGMRNVDIASRLGMNASTVSTVLSRAVAKMRDVAERDA